MGHKLLLTYLKHHIKNLNEQEREGLAELLLYTILGDSNIKKTYESVPVEKEYKNIIFTKNKVNKRRVDSNVTISDYRTKQNADIIEITIPKELFEWLGEPTRCSICFLENRSIVIYSDEQGVSVRMRSKSQNLYVISLPYEAKKILLENKELYKFREKLVAVKKEANSILPKHIIIEV